MLCGFCILNQNLIQIRGICARKVYYSYISFLYASKSIFLVLLYNPGITLGRLIVLNIQGRSYYLTVIENIFLKGMIWHIVKQKFDYLVLC